MRRTILSFIIVLAAFFSSTTAEAQIRFGVRAGLNMTKITEDLLNSDYQAGFFVGPTLEAVFPVVGLGADISLYYDQKKAKIAPDNESGLNKNLSYITLPINARWNFGSRKFGVYIATGPQFSWNISGQKIDEVASTKQYKWKSSLFSWNFGAGVNFAKHFRLGYTFNLGCGRTADIDNMSQKEAEEYIEKIHNNSHQVHLTYFF